MTQNRRDDRGNQENKKTATHDSSNRGFASMDPEKQHKIASEGGKAAAQSGNTSNRGFASMDPEKQRQIASKGGKNSHGGRNS